ncbi:MAG: hypothetical protein IPI66_14025 [Chitinophagaceae bacterium]|nr:hypothetical protein [Chitinophagaceae bacterium]
MSLHYTRALNLVRIVQEARTNAIKHADAGNITIESRQEKEKWLLTVSDDGKGFVPEELSGTEQGNGLNNMKKRALDSNIAFSLVSGRETGTIVRMLI